MTDALKDAVAACIRRAECGEDADYSVTADIIAAEFGLNPRDLIAAWARKADKEIFASAPTDRAIRAKVEEMNGREPLSEAQAERALVRQRALEVGR